MQRDRLLLSLTRMAHVVEVFDHRHVEVDPHPAVVGQIGERFVLLDKAIETKLEAVDDAVEGEANHREGQICI